MEAVEQLSAIEEIKRLKSRYFMALDTRDMAAYARVFTDDARIDVRGSVTSTDGGDGDAGIADFDDDAVLIGGVAMAEFVTRVAAGVITVHQGFMPDIEIQSSTRAKAIWSFEDRLWFPDPSEYSFLHGFGHYHETYRKLEDGWRIDSMSISRLKVELS